MSFFQAPVCDSFGLDCAKNQVAEKEKCLIPCEGVYADIRKEPGQIVDVFTPGMWLLMEAYEKYKNQFYDDALDYPIEGCSHIFYSLIKN